MRIGYTLDELRRIYERLVTKAENAYKKNNLNRSVKCIQSAAELQYYVNDRYTDVRLEKLLQDISSQYSEEDLCLDNKTVLFYDSFCLDNRGLTQQYLDALVFCKLYKIVYILEHEKNSEGSNILDFAEKHGIEVITLPQGSWKERCNLLYNCIKRYKPHAALFHLTPWTAIPFIAFYPFKGIAKFQINLTDHAFWLGSKDFFNFSYEFRHYGIEVSLSKRCFKKEQIILNPYYPWQSGLPFAGFPVSTEGKVILFSGGAMYKIEGDNDMYFKLAKRILDKYQNTILFYAGDGNRAHLEKFIKENGYEERFLLLGNRKDIDALFRQCDIYISTYPFGGGLMSQFAAINEKPILIYSLDWIGKLICTKKYAPISISSEEEYIEEAGKLINNEKYRHDRGKFLRSLMIGQEEFRESFYQSFVKKDFHLPENYYEEIDYDAFTMGYVKRINDNSFGFIERLALKNNVISLKIVLNLILLKPYDFMYRIRRKVKNEILKIIQL